MAENQELGSLKIEWLQELDKKIKVDPAVKMAMNAVTRGNLQEIGLNRDVLNQNSFIYSEEIENKASITDQKKSGTCWMFANTNWVRSFTQKKLNVEGFNYSHNFIMFWDKFEKAHSFLESIIEHREKSLDDRRVNYLIKHPISDGGEWALFLNIVRKYGLVPEAVMPDTFNRENSRFINGITGYKLREFAYELRKMHLEGIDVAELRKRKVEQMQDIYRMMVIFFGNPPEKFDWSYRDKDKKYEQLLQITPKDFAQKYAGIDFEDNFCIVSSPMKNLEYEKIYSMEFFNNIHELPSWKWLNLSISEMKEYALKILQDGNTCLFGCDVLQDCHSKLGILDTELYNYDKIFQTQFAMNKSERFETGQSFYTHCMVLAGVELVDGKPVRWKIENSWGEKVGEKGFFTMSDKWFDEHMVDVWVPRKYMKPEHIELYKQEPVVLPAWHAI